MHDHEYDLALYPVSTASFFGDVGKSDRAFFSNMQKKKLAVETAKYDPQVCNSKVLHHQVV